MSNPTRRDGGNGDGGAVQDQPGPMLQVTFNPRTFTVTIAGSVPTWEFAKAMLQMAVDEAERNIQKKRAEKLISVAGPELLSGFPPAKG